MSKDIENNEDDNLPSHEQSAAYLESYGKQASQKKNLLRFTKGDYVYGKEEDNTGLPIGTVVIMDLSTLQAGWQKWEEGKPTEANIGFVNEGFQPKPRDELGDDDKDLWEIDEDSKDKTPRDPWQFSNLVIVRQLGTTGDDGLFTFVTASRGGLSAIGEVCKVGGRKMREDPETCLPIVELNFGSYAHSNKSFGRIKYPVFKIVGWASAAEIEDATETVVEEVDEETTKPKTAPKKPEPPKKAAAAAKKSEPKKIAPPAGKKKGVRF
jgi:hypothetical protein